MRLLKMHGIGNDYVYADCMHETISEPEKFAVRISDRHFGVGGDGLIMICPSDVADCRMQMYNNDGSEGRMCGNGIRCVGKFMHDSGYISGDSLTVETKSGIKALKLLIDPESGSCTGATVDMGVPTFTPARIPMVWPEADTLNVKVSSKGKTYDAVCVNVGNPHCVIFVDNADMIDPSACGPEIERSPMFPEGVNVEFVTVLDRRHLRMRVWERGTGITMACGTGSVASACAAVLKGFTDSEVTVRLDGGDLLIRYDKDTGRAYMTGAATYVFDVVNYQG